MTCFQFDKHKNAVEVTATTCDGNPECYLGEDECLEECDYDVKKTGGFCDLWSNRTGYECKVGVAFFFGFFSGAHPAAKLLLLLI